MGEEGKARRGCCAFPHTMELFLRNTWGDFQMLRASKSEIQACRWFPAAPSAVKIHPKWSLSLASIADGSHARLRARCSDGMELDM